MSHIRIDRVSKHYGDYHALRDVSLQVEEGEIVSLLGPSGCGKTSLLRSIAGLEDIQGGSISIGERQLSGPGQTTQPERRNVGLIFQSYALWPHMTVFDNIAYALKLRRWKKTRIAERVAEVLGVVGLDGLASRYPGQLSGGQMQRVAVARSLAASPSVLLFDEPLSNLDAKLRESMRVELRRIQKQIGTTSVYVTHDQAEAMVISDRIVLMDTGHIVQEGTARELYESPRTDFAARFLGFTSFLPADVDSIDPARGTACYRLQGHGGDRALVTGRHRDGVGRGDQVNLSIRPEAITLHTEDDVPTALPAVIAELFYTGNVCDVFLDMAGTTIRSQATPMEVAELREGQKVGVTFDQRSVWPIPLEAQAPESEDLAA